MNIVITEPTDITNTKSVGCFYIEDVVRRNGFNISYVPFFELRKTNADIYLFSIHHVRDIFYLKYLPRFLDEKIKIAGGHCMNNPYPFLHFFDIICVGEGESWILQVLDICKKVKTKKEIIRECLNIEGTLTIHNIDCEIRKRYENNIQDSPCYFNESHNAGHKDTWYIEIARGCKSKCNYCELGWTSKYREKSVEKIKEQIDSIDKSKSNRVNIFAPDDFSHSCYDEVIQYILSKNLVTNFGSMRYDRFRSIKKVHKKSFLFRIGLDGLSERCRDIMNKHVKADDLIELIAKMAYDGFVMFKLFMIFSYPWENDADFFEFENMIKRLNMELRDLERPIFIRIKFTPLVPNPLTPVEYILPQYNVDRRKQIENFFLEQKYARRNNVVYIDDGILEPFNYYAQAFLARADYEDIEPQKLKDRKFFNFISEELAKKKSPRRHIITNIDEAIRKKEYEIMKNKIERYYV